MSFSIEDLIRCYLSDIQRFPDHVKVVLIDVEKNYEGKLVVRRNDQDVPKPDFAGAVVTSDEIPLQEYEVYGRRLLAGYSHKARVLLLGVVDGLVRNHAQGIVEAKALAEELGDKDYMDIYWYATTGRWPTENERIIMDEAGYVHACPTGLKKSFPLRNNP